MTRSKEETGLKCKFSVTGELKLGGKGRSALIRGAMETLISEACGADVGSPCFREGSSCKAKIRGHKHARCAGSVFLIWITVVAS